MLRQAKAGTRRRRKTAAPKGKARPQSKSTGSHRKVAAAARVKRAAAERATRAKESVGLPVVGTGRRLHGWHPVQLAFTSDGRVTLYVPDRRVRACLLLRDHVTADGPYVVIDLVASGPVPCPQPPDMMCWEGRAK